MQMTQIAAILASIYQSQSFTWTPASQQETVLWLDGSDAQSITQSNGVVSSWANKAGSASAATSTGAARPTYAPTVVGGRPGVSFDGVDDRMAVTIPALPAATIYVVGRSMSSTLPDSNSQVIAATRPSGSNTPGFAIIGKTYASTVARTIQVEGTVQTRVIENRGFSGSGFTVSQGEAWAVMGQYASGGAETVFSIGSYTNSSNFGQHDICEVIVFNGVVSQETRFNVETYLQRKYGLEMDARPLWVFEKSGIVVNKPSAMTSGNGVYYPCIVDMLGVPNFPARYAVYFSSDHATGAGGIYLYITDNLFDAASYQSYDDAVAAGKFNYLSIKPPANPIYVDQVIGSQTETPELRWVNGTLVMTYQQQGAGNNQSTIRAKGTDGVNFARDRVIVDYVPGEELGDGHTGYFKWGPNPFHGVNYAYIGYSGHGGQSRPTAAQWGTNDPVNGNWSLIALMPRLAGRLKQGTRVMEWNAIDLTSVRRVGDNYSVLVPFESPTSGAAARDGAIYEILLASDGLQPMSQPIQVLPKGATYDAGEVTTSSLIFDGTNYVGVYQAADTNNLKNLAAARSPRRLVESANYLEILPSIPAALSTRNQSFAGVSGVPNGFSVISQGSIAPVIDFGSDGLRVTTDSGSINGEACVFYDEGFTPNSLNYVEIWFSGLESLGATQYRIPFLGFSSSKDYPSVMQDGFFFSNGGGTSALLFHNYAVAGAVTSVASSVYSGVGYNSGDATAPKSFGIRWFVGSDRFIILGESGLEMDEYSAAATNLDKTKTYFPFFGVRSQSGQNVELLRSMRIVYG